MYLRRWHLLFQVCPNLSCYSGDWSPSRYGPALVMSVLNYRPGLCREGSRGAGTGSSKTASWRARAGRRKAGPYSAVLQSPFPKLCAHGCALFHLFVAVEEQDTSCFLCFYTASELPSCAFSNLEVARGSLDGATEQIPALTTQACQH